MAATSHAEDSAFNLAEDRAGLRFLILEQRLEFGIRIVDAGVNVDMTQYAGKMKVEVDQAALAGAAAAGVIAISASEGAFEPFESVAGVVLFILLAAYYRLTPVAPGVSAWIKAIPPAAVGGLVISLIAAFPVQWALVGNSTAESPYTSRWLCLVWLISSTVLMVVVRNGSRPANPQASTAQAKP
ncbi:hypothetical protein K1W54_23920 [Micromonospora sp. CPCC 205371]|nr:hypothetical protein [Micromonospora sp. CPCC 205371]